MKEYIIKMGLDEVEITQRSRDGGVTAFLRDYNMISDEGVIIPKQSKWKYDDKNTIVKLYIEE